MSADDERLAEEEREDRARYVKRERQNRREEVRILFAAKAMASLIGVSPPLGTTPAGYIDAIPAMAFNMAERMLAEWERQPL